MYKLFILLTLSCATIVQSQSANTDYIILKTGVDGQNKQNSARVAFYIDLPDSSNFSGKNFRTIAILTRGDTSRVSFLTGSLLDSLAIGAKLEIIRTVRFDAGLTNVQKRIAIDNIFTNSITDLLEKWYAEHNFYGLERIVP